MGLAMVSIVAASGLLLPPREHEAHPTWAHQSPAYLVSPYIVYAGHSITLVAAQTPSGCDQIFLSSDLVHWTNLSTRLPQSLSCYFWGSAAFVSPRDGWLLGRNAGNVDTVLEHTTNGGLTWSSQPGGSAGTNGGLEEIGFSNDRDGWRQQIAIGASGPFALQSTADAGQQWSNVPTSNGSGCQYLPYVFSAPKIGYAGEIFGSTPTQTGGFYFPSLWQTTDAGTSWSVERVGRPPSVPPSATALMGLPTFIGSAGWLADVFVVAQHEYVVIYWSHNYGTTWSEEMVLPVVGVVRAAGSGPCAGSKLVTRGKLVAVSSSSRGVWWVLRPPASPGALPEVFRMERYGSSWRVAANRAKDLPIWTAGRDGVSLSAVNLRSALVTLQGDGYTQLYRTKDGGRTWVLIRLRG
jgi:photosystem II stability/assembly factor-like uncharacterized protein